MMGLKIPGGDFCCSCLGLRIYVLSLGTLGPGASSVASGGVHFFVDEIIIVTPAKPSSQW